MNDEQIEQQIQAKGLTAPRVTKEQIEALMARVSYMIVQPPGTTSTLASAFLDQTFYLTTGHSACVSLENFDAELGQEIAIDNAAAQAAKKLWELEGYALYRELRGQA